MNKSFVVLTLPWAFIIPYIYIIYSDISIWITPNFSLKDNLKRMTGRDCGLTIPPYIILVTCIQ